MSKAFGAAPANNCALASVKSQIGHLGAAAGVVGLIRATLAVYHGILPANLGFNRINPQIDLQHTPFYIPTRPHAWPEGRRRVAGVSSFGIGGTNAHVIVAAAPAVEPATAPGPACLLISAHSRSALLRNIAAIKAYRDEFPDQHEALLRFLQSGRRQQRWRYGVRLEAGGQWLVEEALIREVPLSSEAWPAQDATPEDILRAWYEGARIVWPKRSAAPPWNLPPSAFDLETCRALPDWFYQRQWVRVRRLEAGPLNGQRGTLVVCTAEALAGGLLVRIASNWTRLTPRRCRLCWPSCLSRARPSWIGCMPCRCRSAAR